MLKFSDYSALEQFSPIKLRFRSLSRAQIAELSDAQQSLLYKFFSRNAVFHTAEDIRRYANPSRHHLTLGTEIMRLASNSLHETYIHTAVRYVFEDLEQYRHFFYDCQLLIKLANQVQSCTTTTRDLTPELKLLSLDSENWCCNCYQFTQLLLARNSTSISDEMLLRLSRYDSSVLALSQALLRDDHEAAQFIELQRSEARHKPLQLRF
jgi:hypothetical protein